MNAGNRVLPYELIVGQDDLKLALELAYVNPAIGGVLAAGQRGTAKTTTVRAFALAVAGELPVTLPIGATEDRVLGGWQIDKLMQGEAEPQEGLLVQASESRARMLYIDEINLLDDYLVNIILDVVSTGNLDVQREHRAESARRVDFTLVGTMNPDEGGLRPQLLDRFGLVAMVEPVESAQDRMRVLEAVMQFEIGPPSPRDHGATLRSRVEEARSRLARISVRSMDVRECAELAAAFNVPGHRGQIVLLQAARALAAIEDTLLILPQHISRVAKLALVHRRTRGETGTVPAWTEEDDRKVAEVFAGTEANRRDRSEA
ncbi:AAA family ATPase [Streptomycetaceae bacterium NBC_01309]